MSVSSPYRYAKNNVNRLLRMTNIRVSSPYRYAKNSPIKEIKESYYEVSSPYRYAKNLLCLPGPLMRAGFQVLIGTLKTVEES